MATLKLMLAVLETRNKNNDNFTYFPKIKTQRHTTVCHVAQEASAPHHGYIDRKKENAATQFLIQKIAIDVQHTVAILHL